MAKFYTLKNIDPAFWQQVKILAAKKGVTIKKLIFELLKKEISLE